MPSFISSWGVSSSVPATTDTPAQHCAADIATRDDIYKTLNVNMDLTNGLLKSDTTANRSTVYASPSAGNFFFNTTTGWLEIYDGSAWRPLGWSKAEQLSFTTATSSTEIRFTINSGSALNYSGYVDLTVMLWIDSAPSLVGDTITLKCGTALGTYGTTLTTRSMMSTAVGERIIKYTGALTSSQIYFQVTVSSGTIRASVSGDSQMYYKIVGTGA